MFLKDIFEAISVSKYDHIINKAINNAVQESVGAIASFGISDQARKNIMNDEGSYTVIRDDVESKIKSALKSNLARFIKDDLNKVLGDYVISGVDFQPITGNTNAYVNGTYMVLNEKVISKFAAKSAEKLIDMVYNSYNTGEERLAGLYDFAKDIARGDRRAWGDIHYDIRHTVDQLTSTILHELVHVIQHRRQERNNFTDFEYRSYLDKHKGEFKKLASGPHEHNDEYFNLYLASPQEIAAFAHEAALTLIKDYSLDEIQSANDVYSIDARDIVDYVDSITGNRYKNPKTPKEQSVRNRYMKLIYQEVHRYIESKLARLKK